MNEKDASQAQLAMDGVAKLLFQQLPEDVGFYIVVFDQVGSDCRATGHGTPRKAIGALRSTANSLEAKHQPRKVG